MPLVLVAHDGSELDTIGSFPAAFVAEQRSDADQTLVLSPSSHFTVRDNEIIVGDASDYHVFVLRSDGSLTARMRWSGPNLRVPESEHAAWRAGIVETAYTSPGQDPQDLLDWVAGLKFAERKGAYVELRSDTGGNIWIRENNIATVPPRYTVLARDGEMLGSIDLPARFTLTHIGDDHVLGVWKDTLDVESVRLYALRKPD